MLSFRVVKIKDISYLEILRDRQLVERIKINSNEVKNIGQLRQRLNDNPKFNQLSNLQIKKLLGIISGAKELNDSVVNKIIDSLKENNMGKFKIGNKIILAKDALSALKIAQKIDDTTVYDDETIILKEMAKVIAEYNKAKEDYRKFDNWGYDKIDKGIKGNGWRRGENLSNNKWELMKRLKEKLPTLEAKFESLKQNARRAIGNTIDFKLNSPIVDKMGTDANDIYNKLQEKYNAKSGENKVSNMHNLSQKVREIVGRMSEYSRTWWTGKVDYIPSEHVYRINLSLNWNASERGKDIRTNQVLKEVKRYWPNAYVDRHSIYIPEKDVVKDSISDSTTDAKQYFVMHRRLWGKGLAEDGKTWVEVTKAKKFGSVDEATEFARQSATQGKFEEWRVGVIDSLTKDSEYLYFADPQSDKEIIDKARKESCRFGTQGNLTTIIGNEAQFGRVFNMSKEELDKACLQQASAIKKIKDVAPREGESKDNFLNRFMSETEKEYPDKKQRFAVALSYWNKAQDSINDAAYKGKALEMGVDDTNKKFYLRTIKYPHQFNDLNNLFSWTEELNSDINYIKSLMNKGYKQSNNYIGDNIRDKKFPFEEGELKIGQKIKYGNYVTPILDLEWDDRYGYDVMIRNERGQNIWIGNGNTFTLADSIHDSSDALQNLIMEEEKAIEDYKNAIASSDDNDENELLQDILKDEVDHLTALKARLNGANVTHD